MPNAPANQFNRVFPDPSLTVDYDKALSFVQLALKRFPHGQLKVWAADNEMNYATLTSLRNNTLRRPAPLQAQKVLGKLNFPTEVIRVTREGKSTHEFVFLGAVAFDLFHQQLQEYENTTTKQPTPAAGE